MDSLRRRSQEALNHDVSLRTPTLEALGAAGIGY